MKKKSDEFNDPGNNEQALAAEQEGKPWQQGNKGGGFHAPTWPEEGVQWYINQGFKVRAKPSEDAE